MKLHFRINPGDDARALWVLATILLIGGLYSIETHYEHAIAASRGLSESYYRRMLANERIVKQARVLNGEKLIVLRDLAHVSREHSLASSMAAAVSALDQSASKFALHVTAFLPDTTQRSAVSAPLASTSFLHATPVTIKTRGKFLGVLRLIEDASHYRTLISIGATQLAVAVGANGRRYPELDTTIHATLYRLQLPAEKEMHNAAAR